MRADGTGEPEMVLSDGFLVETISPSRETD
jgi:hypothetical protein